LYKLSKHKKMKGIEFISEANEIFQLEYGRVIKQATGLRKLDLYPDGRDQKSEVSTTNAGHLVRVLALNLNPFAEDFLKQIEEHKQLVSEDGSSFITDLSAMLEHGGILPSKNGLQAVQRISFSLDRPFVAVTFEDTDAEPEDLVSEKGLHVHYNHKSGLKTYRSEKTYGPGPAKSFERFAVLKRSSIQQLASALSRVPEVVYGGIL
jgi:hypothetical protein